MQQLSNGQKLQLANKTDNQIKSNFTKIGFGFI